MGARVLSYVYFLKMLLIYSTSNTHVKKHILGFLGLGFYLKIIHLIKQIDIFRLPSCLLTLNMPHPVWMRVVPGEE